MGLSVVFVQNIYLYPPSFISTHHVVQAAKIVMHTYIYIFAKCVELFDNKEMQSQLL